MVSTIVADPTDPTGERQVTLHAPESPEIYFEDYGEGHLVHGFAHVEIDPIFAGNVTISEQHPLRVFLQLEENESTRGVIVKNKTAHGFDVVELGGGASNHALPVAHRLQSRRRGAEEWTTSPITPTSASRR